MIADAAPLFPLLYSIRNTHGAMGGRFSHTGSTRHPHPIARNRTIAGWRAMTGMP